MNSTALLPHCSVRDVLLPVYAPCIQMSTCKQAKWVPAEGHLPRGFIGATGTLEEVEVVMVSAEPGHPTFEEGDMDFSTALAPAQMLASTVQVSWNRRATGQSAYHRNFNWFCDQLWPDLTAEERLRHLWMTNARLCSIDNEIGATPRNPCAETHLIRQLALFPSATIIGFGVKAKRDLERLKVDFVGAWAFANPGANQPQARVSWQNAIEVVRSRRWAVR